MDLLKKKKKKKFFVPIVGTPDLEVLELCLYCLVGGGVCGIVQVRRPFWSAHKPHHSDNPAGRR